MNREEKKLYHVNWFTVCTFLSLLQLWHSFFFPPNTWPRTESGACADLLRCIPLTDRLIVDKQLNSMPAPPRPSLLCRLSVPRSRCDLLAHPRMTTMLHPSLSLRHKRVLCGAGCHCLLVSLCHHYRVTRQENRSERQGGGEGGDCATAAGAGVTQVHRYHIMSPFVFIQVNPKWQLSTFEPRGTQANAQNKISDRATFSSAAHWSWNLHDWKHENSWFALAIRLNSEDLTGETGNLW